MLGLRMLKSGPEVVSISNHSNHDNDYYTDNVHICICTHMCMYVNNIYIYI